MGSAAFYRIRVMRRPAVNNLTVLTKRGVERG